MKCPHCSVKLNVTREDAGKMLRCPGCSDFFKVKSLEKCPSCGEDYFDRVRICINCGYDFELCEVIRTKTDDDPEPEELSLPVRFIVYLFDACPGLLRPSTLISFILACIVALGMMFLGLVMFLVAGVFITGVIIMAFAVFTYMHGVAFICTGEICTLKTGFENMQGESWSMFLTLTFLPLIIAILFMGIAQYFVDFKLS